MKSFAVPSELVKLNELLTDASSPPIPGNPILTLTELPIDPITRSERDTLMALVQHPDVACGIGQIVSMSGAFTAMGHRTPWAEFNVYADPHAAEIVFQSGVPIVIMPLDMTFQALFTAEHFEQFRSGGAAGAALFNLFSTFDRSDVNRFGRPGGPIHDATTIAWLIRPELFTSREAFVGVEVTGLTMGYTYADFYKKMDRAANATVMTDVDAAGFMELLIERIARYGGAGLDRKTLGGSQS